MDVYIQKSNIEGKKWKAQFIGDKKKTVHFGQAGALDYTKHKKADRDARRESYLARHGSYENWEKDGVMTPGWLSRWLLWEKPTMKEAMVKASRKAGMKFHKGKPPA